jgi:hypothetical protein
MDIINETPAGVNDQNNPAPPLVVLKYSTLIRPRAWNCVLNV